MDALSLWAISNTPASLAIQTVLYFLSWRIQACSTWEDFSASTLNNTPLTILSLTSNCCKSERLTHQKHKEMAPQPAMMTWWTIFSRVSILLSSFCNISLLSIDTSMLQEVDETSSSLSFLSEKEHGWRRSLESMCHLPKRRWRPQVSNILVLTNSS